MSNVLVSRNLKSGNVAFVAFLLDVYCLGVKDVAFDVVSRSRYDRQIYGKLIESYEPVALEPAAALKLIEGAVEYAKQCGLSPHRDYRIGKPIFGDIDSASCGEEFIYGDNGKPFFIAGPNDRPSRCRQIIDLLTAHCGPDGFTFLMPTSGSPRLLP
jgi:hypothetical protein